MNVPVPAGATLLLAILAGPAGALDDESGSDPARILHRNPFEAPRVPEPEPAEVAARRPPPPPPPPPPWTPELRATLVSGSRSSANVDGRIVEVGGTVDGFRLVEVRERRAVFVKDGKRRVLSMDPTE